MSPNTYLQLGHNKILHLILVLFFGSQKSTMSYGRLCPHFHHLLGNSKISDFYLSFFFLIAIKKSTISCQRPCPKFLSFTRTQQTSSFYLSFLYAQIFTVYQGTALFLILDRSFYWQKSTIGY